jgi:hypothetical protein
VLLKRRIDVEKPSGPTQIPNPLYSYKFQDTSELSDPRFRFNQTVRYPKNTSGLAAVESEDQFLKNIGKDNILVQQEVDDSHGGPRTGPPLLAKYDLKTYTSYILSFIKC